MNQILNQGFNFSNKPINLLFTLSLTLLFLTGCKDKTLQLNKLNPCIKDIEITLKQGNNSQTKKASAQQGVAQFPIGADIDPANPVEVTFKVKSVHNTPDCKELEPELISEIYRFVGSLKPDHTGGHSLIIPDTLLGTKPSKPKGGGTVEGGTLLLPRKKGTGSLGTVIWAESIPGCTHICWQQWSKVEYYLDKEDGKGFQEILKGFTWPDKTNRKQVYGQFGRDIPRGSDGNCFRLDEMPNKP